MLARRLIRTAVLFALVTGLAGGLAGCGRRGSLEAPGTPAAKGSSGIVPGTSSTPAASTAATAPEKPENTPGAVVTPPKRSFVLDPIL